MKALELADQLFLASTRCDDHYSLDRSAAAELLRLAEVNGELLVALKELVAQNETSFFADSVSSSAMKNARRAITKAKEQQ